MTKQQAADKSAIDLLRETNMTLARQLREEKADSRATIAKVMGEAEPPTLAAVQQINNLHHFLHLCCIESSFQIVVLNRPTCVHRCKGMSIWTGCCPFYPTTTHNLITIDTRSELLRGGIKDPVGRHLTRLHPLPPRNAKSSRIAVLWYR